MTQRAVAIVLRAAAVAASIATSLAAFGGGMTPVWGAEFELTTLTQQTLGRLRATSQEWVLAQESGAGANAETAVQDLLGTTQTLGFRRLPDVAIAAGLLAERAARRDDRAGAERALRMAERLDPGRPETSFAAASVARSEGRWLSSLRFEFQGGRRLFDSLPLGRLLRHDLATSAIYVALLSAVAMVALLAGLHGRRVLGVIQGGVGSAIAKPFVIALLALFFLWPLAIDDGIGWTIGLLAVFLCGFVSWHERIVLILALGLFSLAPWALARLERLSAVDASPGVRALDHLSSGRLSGTLFADLETLDAQLPEEPALKAIQAEVHRRLGQWEPARQLYNEMIAASPGDPTPVIGLGAYHFARNDFKRAVEQFQRAVVIDPRSVEAHFNLSQAYGSGYLFGDSRAALAQASAIDPQRVAGWVASPPIERLVVPDPVTLRREELDRALLARRPTVGFGRLPLWAAGLAGWLLASAVGLALYAARRRSLRKPGSGTAPGVAATPVHPLPFANLSPLWAALLPGAASVARGRPLVAWFAWLPVTALLGLAAVSHWTPVLPAPILGGSTLTAVLALLTLALWFGARFLWAKWVAED